MSVPGLDFRPCGACAELVPSDSGCPHWKPGIKVGKRLGWTKKPRTLAASPAADLSFIQVLDRGATRTIQ